MIIRGPFTLKWGDNTIVDVEEIDVEQTIDSEDYETVGGRTIEIDGNYKATATITLLDSDLPALAALLPQHFVANGGVMSTGETVNNADGAIDVAPAACDSSLVFNHLDIESCGNPSQVARIVNARTKLEGVEVDNKLRKVMVKFVGEAASDEATMQFFAQGTINVVS
jgi:hypothetical protein